MTDSNNNRVAGLVEVTFGTTPATAPYIINQTNNSLSAGIGYIESKQLRSSRQSAGPVKVSEAASGSIGFEWQFDTTGLFAQLFAAALQTTASTAATTEVTSVTFTGGANTLAASGIETGIEFGDIVRVRTSGDVDVGYFRVIVVGTNTITIDRGGFADGSSYKVKRGIRTKNGATQKSFSIEVGDTTAALYEVFTGMVPSSMGMTLADGQITSGSINLVGQKSATRGATPVYGSAYTAAPTTYVMDSKANVQVIVVAGTEYSAKSITWQIDNSLRSRTILGSASVQSVASGTFRATGTIEAYFGSWTEYEKFVAGTNSSLYFVMRDAAGNAYAFSFPTVRYSAGEKPTPGQDQDIIQRLTWQGVADATEGITMRVEAFAA